MHANKREELTEADAGNIYAAVGLKDTRTGDTLCDENKPDPPREDDLPRAGHLDRHRAEDEGGRREARRRLCRSSRPKIRRFRIHTDEESGPDDHQRDGRAPPRHHRRPPEARVQSRVATSASPRSRTARRSRKKVACEYKYAKQSGGRGQFGHVLMEIEPGERGAGFVFENDIVGGVIPKEFIPAIEKGVREAMDRGVLAGYPLVDMHCRLYDGSYHDVDSSRAGLRSRRLALLPGGREAGRPAPPRADHEERGRRPRAVHGRRHRRPQLAPRQILGMTQRGNAQVIDAEVPLATMFGYVTDLRSMTQGRATSSLHFSHYAPVPAAIQEEIVAKVKGTAKLTVALSQLIERNSERVMAKEKFNRNKPHVNVGTIGHIDHGKTTLTAALVKVQSKKGLGEGDLVRGHREGRDGSRRDEDGDDRGVARGVRERQAPLRARRLPRPRGLHQEHDHGRGADGRRDPGGVGARLASCRRRASTCCLARQVGLNHIVVFLNKCDAVDDPEMLDLVEMEVRELLNKYKFDGDNGEDHPRRGAPGAQRRRRSGRSRSRSCSTALDSDIPEPVRDIDKPFLMAVEDVFSIKGRGTVVTGRVERGDREDGRRGRDRRLPRHAQDGGDGRRDVPQAARPGAGGRQRRRPAARHREGRRRARADPVQAGLGDAAQEVRGRGLRAEEGGGRPSHAVLHELPSAVLHADDGRDRHVPAPRGDQDGHAGRQRRR